MSKKIHPIAFSTCVSEFGLSTDMFDWNIILDSNNSSILQMEVMAESILMTSNKSLEPLSEQDIDNIKNIYGSNIDINFKIVGKYSESEENAIQCKYVLGIRYIFETRLFNIEYEYLTYRNKETGFSYIEEEETDSIAFNHKKGNYAFQKIFNNLSSKILKSLNQNEIRFNINDYNQYLQRFELEDSEYDEDEKPSHFLDYILEQIKEDILNNHEYYVYEYDLTNEVAHFGYFQKLKDFEIDYFD